MNVIPSNMTSLRKFTPGCQSNDSSAFVRHPCDIGLKPASIIIMPWYCHYTRLLLIAASPSVLLPVERLYKLSFSGYRKIYILFQDVEFKDTTFTNGLSAACKHCVHGYPAKKLSKDCTIRGKSELPFSWFAGNVSSGNGRWNNSSRMLRRLIYPSMWPSSTCLTVLLCWRTINFSPNIFKAF